MLAERLSRLGLHGSALQSINSEPSMNLANEFEWQTRDGAPSYRYFKLIFTAALRLGLALDIKCPLHIRMDGAETDAPKYKTRRTYEGFMIINGERHDDLVFVVDEQREPAELVTFWRKQQRGDAPGTKGGAHPFAELYMGYLRGKTLEHRTFDTRAVASLCEQYNREANFNVQAWIVNNVPADLGEPPPSKAPVDLPSDGPVGGKDLPDLQLLNKWQTDVRQTGVPYTNYEIDACVRKVTWSNDERISLELHWEDGKYVAVRDFGRHEQYASRDDRRRVLTYLQEYDGRPARVRMILTLKGDSTDWTLASGTMLKRIDIAGNKRIDISGATVEVVSYPRNEGEPYNKIGEILYVAVTFANGKRLLHRDVYPCFTDDLTPMDARTRANTMVSRIIERGSIDPQHWHKDCHHFIGKHPLGRRLALEDIKPGDMLIAASSMHRVVQPGDWGAAMLAGLSPCAEQYELEMVVKEVMSSGAYATNLRVHTWGLHDSPQDVEVKSEDQDPNREPELLPLHALALFRHPSSK